MTEGYLGCISGWHETVAELLGGFDEATELAVLEAGFVGSEGVGYQRSDLEQGAGTIGFRFLGDALCWA
jgi:hypothetical protein